MDLRKVIEEYKPYNEQEQKDKETILLYMDTFDNLLTRENEFAHFTASAWCVNKERTKVLMIYHNIYQSWTLTGGHADGEEDLLKVVLKEVEEETCIHGAKPVMKDPFSIEILTVDGHVKRGKYVSSHLHLNVTYLIEADEQETLKIKPDENSGVKWTKIEDVVKESKEKWIRENIFALKLNKKLLEEKQ